MTPVVEPSPGILQLFGDFPGFGCTIVAVRGVLKGLSTRPNSVVHNILARHSRAPVGLDEGPSTAYHNRGGPKVRRVTRILLLLNLSFGIAGTAEARERLVMPFDCDLDQGRIRLSPAEERSYAIVGNREVATVTSCNQPRSRGCSTLMVHRFVISCGGAGLAWMRVAAAIRQVNAEPAWIEQGRLNVVLPVRPSSAAHAPCMQRPTFALGRMLERRVAYTGGCEARGDDFEHVVLPAGYAPVDEFGARVELAAGGTPPPPIREEADASFRHVSAEDTESVLARANPDDIVAPIPGLEPYDAEIDEAVASDDWVTVVRTERDYGGASAADASAGGPWAWLLAAMALATLAGLVRVRASYSWSGWLFAVAPGFARSAEHLDHWWHTLGGRSAPESFINAGAAVKALLRQTEEVVAELKGGAALREVLCSELKLVRQTLKNVEAVARDSDEGDDQAAVRSAAHYRALVRELERIRRIAESAAASLSSARPTGSLPRTTSEAYAVLGVNPDVSEGVLKKIVDALRMSWHPDHARDDDDRMVREDRMRQINIAWELISGARQAV